MAKPVLGVFEQHVLLSIVEMVDEAYAMEVGRLIESRTERSVSRGALYTTFDRLEEKGYLAWSISTSTPPRRGVPRRRFVVTELGLEVLRSCRAELANRLDAFDSVLETKV